MIKHISFDLWMTLIQSHPEFKLRRAQLIIDMFDIKGYHAQDIDAYVRKVDKVFDRKNMISGQKLSANKMYCKILKKILPENKNVTEAKAIELRKKSDELFLEYTPVFLNKDIPNILAHLKNDGYNLNLSSNTGFVEGDILRITLEKLEIIKYFNFLVFSDEINASKPSSLFFKFVHEYSNVEKEEILHIGDNPKADYMGAKSFGFEALLITDNNYSINDIKRKL